MSAGGRQTAPTILFVLALFAMAATAGLMKYWVFVALHGGAPALTDFLKVTCVWDCGLYRFIAKHGYEVVGERPDGLSFTWAFFPLRPMLDALATTISGGAFELASYLVSVGLCVGAAVAARPCFHRDRAAWLFGAYLVIGPLTPALSAGYSESLFILLTILAMRTIADRHYVQAGVLGALLSATRLPGILLTAAIAANLVADHFKGGGRVADLPAAIMKKPSVLLGLMLCPLRLLGFAAFLHVHTGDALAFLHAQAIWGRGVNWPWVGVWKAVGGNEVSAVHTLALLLALGVSVAMAVRGRWAEAAFCIAVLVVSSAGGLISMTRFVLGLAPLVMFVTDRLSARSAVFWAAMITIPLLCLAATFSWLSNQLFLV